MEFGAGLRLILMCLKGLAEFEGFLFLTFSFSADHSFYFFSSRSVHIEGVLQGIFHTNDHGSCSL
jgi:hypothetical protein